MLTTWRSNAATTIHFNFSTPELAISEGGDLPSQLSIVKTGQHQGSITVDVTLSSTVPNNGGQEAIVFIAAAGVHSYQYVHILCRLHNQSKPVCIHK